MSKKETTTTNMLDFEKWKTVGKRFSPEELREMARAELNEEPARREKDLKAIKEWIRKQPHLAKTAKQDDDFLLLVLRGCKFSLEKTKRKIEAWNTIRNMCPELFDRWDVEDPDNRELINMGLNIILPGFDKHGRVVVVQRLNLADPKKYKPDDVMRVCSMITDLWMGPFAQLQGDVCGVVVISDSVGATMTHLTNYSPAWAKKVTTIFEDMYPSRPKVMHFINMPGFLDTIYNFFKGLMKKKVQDRMRVHPKGDLSGLVEDLGLDILPEDYGGTNGTLEQHAATQAKITFAYRDYLLRQTKHKSNEKKRQGAVKTYSDIFGMEGSFRQLEFD